MSERVWGQGDIDVQIDRGWRGADDRPMRWTATLVVAAAGVAFVVFLARLWPSVASTTAAGPQDSNPAEKPAATPTISTLPNQASTPRDIGSPRDVSLPSDVLEHDLPYVDRTPLRFDVDMAALSFNKEMGLSLDQFVAAVGRASGKRVKFHARDAREAPRVRLDDVHLPRVEFLAFLRAVMATQAYRCTTQGRGEAEVVEVVPTDPGEGHADVGDAPLRFVSYRELAGRRNAGHQNKGDAKDADGESDTRILTAVPLVHPDAVELQAHLLRYFANLDSKVGIWIVGSTDVPEEMVLWGSTADIRRAMDLIAQLDLTRNPDFVVETIVLRHTDAEEVKQYILSLVLSGPRLVNITVRPRDNALIVKGDKTTVDAVRELIALKDVGKEHK